MNNNNNLPLLESFPSILLDSSGSAVMREVWNTDSAFTGKTEPAAT